MKLRIKIPLLIAGFVLITTVVLFVLLSGRQRISSQALYTEKILLSGSILEALGKKTLIVDGTESAVGHASQLDFKSLLLAFARSDAIVYAVVLDSDKKIFAAYALANSNSVWEVKDPGRKHFNITAIQKAMEAQWFGPVSELVLYTDSFKAVALTSDHASVRSLHFRDFMNRLFRRTVYKNVNIHAYEIPIGGSYGIGANEHKTRIIGYLEIGLSKDFIDRMLLKDVLAVLPYVLVIFLVIIVIAVIFSLDIVFAVNKLSIGTTEIGAGNLEHRISMKRKDELGIWADLFNKMAERLKKTMDELKDKYEEISRLFKLATEDGLTKAFVHRYLMDIFENEMKRSKRQNSFLSFLMTDIDHFKKFNDTWGHQTGDFVLEQVAKILLENVRKNIDTVGRYGGEEFGVILSGTDKKGAIQAAEKLRKLIETAKFNWKGTELQVRISIGVSSVRAASATKETMVKWADKALYHSKESGRNRTTFYSEDKDV